MSAAFCLMMIVWIIFAVCSDVDGGLYRAQTDGPAEVAMEVKQYFPLFAEGRILKKDALDIIRDYAPDFFSLLFEEYGNGIVCGFQIRGQGKEIRVGPGILKNGPAFFCLKEEARLQYSLYGQMVQIVLKRTADEASADFQEQTYRLTLEPVRTLGEEEYELGRFMLEQGARLRAYEDYKDFNDLTTEFNTLNAVHVPFSCQNGSSLAPFILRLYGRGVLHSPKAEPLDLSFAALCLNGSRISSQLIREYLLVREQAGDNCQSNLQLYLGLRRLYTRIVSGGEARRNLQDMSGKTMID